MGSPAPAAPSRPAPRSTPPPPAPRIDSLVTAIDACPTHAAMLTLYHRNPALWTPTHIAHAAARRTLLEAA